MKKYLIFCPLFLFSFCQKDINTPSVSDQWARVSVNKMADDFGNKDNTITPDELELVDNYFRTNKQAWFITIRFQTEDDIITAENITNNFVPTSHPYKSFAELKNAYKGINIKTPVVGICCIIKENDFYVAHVYHCPGPSVDKGPWEKLCIVN